MLPEKLKIIHQPLYVFGFALMAVSLPFSLFLMSLSQFVLAGNWLLEGDFNNKWFRLKQNAPALMTMGIFILYALGLIWTTNISEGINQLRMMAPVFVFPMIASSINLIDRVILKKMLLLFVFAVFFSSLYSMSLALRSGVDGLGDMRNLSPFVSHIRFSLMICMAIALLFERLSNDQGWGNKVLSLMLLAWFIFFLFFVQSLTGLIVLLILSMLYLLFVMLPRLKRIYQVFTAAFVMIVGVMGVFLLYQDYKNYANAPIINTDMLPEFTSYGNPYNHDLNNLQIENGNYIWLFICESELRSSWNQRSSVDYDGEDAKGHPLRATLIRYLNSLGYSKDADGLSKLTVEDIKMIEAGHANFVYTRMGDYRQRLYQIYFEFDNARNTSVPDGQSILLRSELWRNAWHVIKKNPLLGSGTGDLKDEFNIAFKERETELNERWWLLSHNQYLTIFGTFGVLGLITFLILFAQPWLSQWNQLLMSAKGFFIIFSVSMISEDTLTSQAGVSFFVFFTSIFILMKYGLRFTKQ
ncbi:MAG: O-antigen ligase family protein [Flavobacteriales bacterium]